MIAGAFLRAAPVPPPARPRRRRAAGRVSAALAVLAGLAAGCSGSGQPPLITVYVPDIAVSLPLPQGWRSAAGEQGGFRMTTFTGSSVDVLDRAGIQVQVMAGPMPDGRTLREVADLYIGGQEVGAERDYRIGMHEGRIWEFASAAEERSGRLLLVEVGEKLYGMWTTGEERTVLAYRPSLDAMYDGFAIETAPLFESYEEPGFGLSVRHPRSWERAHVLRDGNLTLSVGFRSGALAVESTGLTVHASLEVTVREAPPGTTLSIFFAESRHRLGDSARLLAREDLPGRRGHAALYAVETQLVDYLEWVVYNVAAGRTYTYRFRAPTPVFRAIEPWLREIARGLPGRPARAGSTA